MQRIAEAPEDDNDLDEAEEKAPAEEATVEDFVGEVVTYESFSEE